MDPWLFAWVNYYEELGVSSSASIRVIQAAYRAMAQDYHPDGGRYADAERMKRINIAFEVLSDAGVKQRYDDAYRRRQQRRTAHAPGSPPPPGNRTTRPASSSPPPRQDIKHGAGHDCLVVLLIVVIVVGLEFCVLMAIGTTFFR